jgi:hypothetical protein
MKRWSLWMSLAGLAFCCPGPLAVAADWPMWRYDAARSAAAPAEIALKPVLLWSRKLPPVRQAWPLEVYQRLNFDASYEPVVMGNMLQGMIDIEHSFSPREVDRSLSPDPRRTVGQHRQLAGLVDPQRWSTEFWGVPYRAYVLK